jgi:hypothetical protein
MELIEFLEQLDNSAAQFSGNSWCGILGFSTGFSIGFPCFFVWLYMVYIYIYI